MKEFIDTSYWPLVALHMPEQVADEQAAGLVNQLESLYSRAEPFALLMDGIEFPRQSGRFMAAWTQWGKSHLTLQQRYCVGAIRIEAEEALRREYARKAEAWNASGRAPYPYRVVATRAEAEAQARAWLAGHGIATTELAPTATGKRQ